MDEIYSERNSHYQFTLTLNFLLLNFSLFSLLTSKRQLGFFLFVSPPPFFFLLDANTDNHPTGQLYEFFATTDFLFLFFKKSFP